MRISEAWKASVLASVAVIAMALAGCGSSSNSTSGPPGTKSPAAIKNPNARHVDSMAGPAERVPSTAAAGFGAYYTDGDANTCDQPDFSLDGVVSNKVWTEYSCRVSMTPQEVQWHCTSWNGGSGGTDRTKVTTVSRHPLAKHYTNMTWGVQRRCPGHPKRYDRGRYEVTVTHTKAGWIVTDFKTVSGPHS